MSADKESLNEAIVVAGDDGSCYAKSVPEHGYGENGKTQVFRVERESDVLLHTYPWFSQDLHVDCIDPDGEPARVSLVQLGPWPRGCVANRDTLAIAFYRDGRLIRRYSTLDIAGSPTNVHASVWHYTVFSAVLGYRWGSGRQRFVVRTIDERTLIFDTETGDQVTDKNVDLQAGKGAATSGMTSSYIGGRCSELKR